MNKYKKWIMAIVLIVALALLSEAAVVVYVDPFLQ